MKKKVGLLSLLIATLFITVNMASALNIFKESFDDNSSITGWKANNTTYVTRLSGTPKVGEACMQIAGAYEAITYQNTGPFKNLVLSFKLAGKSFTPDDWLEAYVDYGIGFVKIATLYYSQANSTFKSFSYNVPQGYRSFKIKFKMFADSTARLGYVDDILLTGTW